MNVPVYRRTAWMGLIVLLLGQAVLMAQTNSAQNLFSTSFEVGEGYDPNYTLAGQGGWIRSGSGGNGLVTNTFPGRGQQAYVGFFPPEGNTNFLSVGRPINYVPDTNAPGLVTLSTSVLIVNSTNQHYDDFRWSVYNQQTNHLLSITFDNERHQIWTHWEDRQPTNTGVTFSNDVIYELVVTMNLASNIWNASLSGAILATNQPLTTTNTALNLGQVEAGWILREAGAAGNNYMVFDDLRVSTPPLAPPPVTPVLYATAFEPEEGFDRGFNLGGQGGWRRAGSGGNGLVTNAFPGRGQQAYIGFFPPEGGTNYLYLWHPINYVPPTNGAARVRFSTSMQIVNSTNQNFDDFRWSVYNTNAHRLFSINFNNNSHRVTYRLDDEGGDFIATGVQFSNDVIYELVVNMNFASNSWNATLSGELLATNQLITTTNALLNLGDVDAVWLVRDEAPGNNYMVFDDYRVTLESSDQPTPPAGPRLEIISGLSGGPPFAVRVEGQPLTSFILDASTNLVEWTAFWTNTVSEDGFSDFVEGPDNGEAYQFFRARQVP